MCELKLTNSAGSSFYACSQISLDTLFPDEPRHFSHAHPPHRHARPRLLSLGRLGARRPSRRPRPRVGHAGPRHHARGLATLLVRTAAGRMRLERRRLRHARPRAETSGPHGGAVALVASNRRPAFRSLGSRRILRGLAVLETLPRQMELLMAELSSWRFTKFTS